MCGGIDVAMYLPVLNDYLIVFKHLELHSFSYFSFFSKGRTPEHIPRYLRMRINLKIFHAACENDLSVRYAR